MERERERERASWWFRGEGVGWSVESKTLYHYCMRVCAMMIDCMICRSVAGSEIRVQRSPPMRI